MHFVYLIAKTQMLRMGVPCNAYNVLWDAALHNDEWKAWEKDNDVRV